MFGIGYQEILLILGLVVVLTIPTTIIAGLLWIVWRLVERYRTRGRRPH